MEKQQQQKTNKQKTKQKQNNQTTKQQQQQQQPKKKKKNRSCALRSFQKLNSPGCLSYSPKAILKQVSVRDPLHFCFISNLINVFIYLQLLDHILGISL